MTTPEICATLAKIFAACEIFHHFIDILNIPNPHINDDSKPNPGKIATKRIANTALKIGAIHRLYNMGTFKTITPRLINRNKNIVEDLKLTTYC